LNHFYRPVIDLYFAIATPLFHGSPVLFHVASVALHAVNALVIFALARLVSRRTLYGFLTALFFVVQPSDIDAIAWVGALAEAVGVLFGCLSVLLFLKWRLGGRAQSHWRVLSVLSFLLALLTHESSVTFLPVLALADWAFLHDERPIRDRVRASGWGEIASVYAPYVVLTLMYLAVDVVVNSRNYVVSQGHYALGWHVVQNALNYVDALYVGRRDPVNYVAISLAVVLLLFRGNRRVRFSTLWLLLSLAPFLFFNWANTARYLYQPAIGFSMLLAEALLYLEGVLAPRAPTAARAAVIALVSGAIAIRFALFALGNVASFAAHTETYRRYVAEFRDVHGSVASYSVVAPDPRLETRLPYPFVNAAVQWHYRDPTIQLTPYESPP
jgi:hypothetical protein